MIYTVTLNPAVDKTIYLNHLQVDRVNRALEVLEDAGGKGINVSKMIKNLGGTSVAMGVASGNTGSFIRQQLEGLGIPHRFTEGTGNTRTNLKLVDQAEGTYTDINEAGALLPETILAQVERELFSLLQREDILILAGSVPANVDKAIYARWIRKAKAAGAKVLLDAEGELLKNGVAAGPYLIKPNIHELESLFQKNFLTEEEMIQWGMALHTGGIPVIVISRGAEGCILICDHSTYRIPALPVEVRSTVGAGDAMVGGLAYGLSQGMSIQEAIILGVAASSATIGEPGTRMGSREQIQTMINRVQIMPGV